MTHSCSDVISIEDLKIAKKHQLFEAEVITGLSGGVAGGEPIDYATNQATGQSQKTMPAILRDIGFQPVAFDFNSGGVLSETNRNSSVLWPLPEGNGLWYNWGGPLPKTIPAASTPYTTGGVAPGAWLPVGDLTLREELDGVNGGDLIGYRYPGEGAVQTTIAKKLNTFIDIVGDFSGGAVAEDMTKRIQDAIIAAYTHGVPVVTLHGNFEISSTILIYPGVELRGFGAGKTYISPSDTFPNTGTMFRFYNVSVSEGVGFNTHSTLSDLAIDAGSISRGISGVDVGDSTQFNIRRVDVKNCHIGIAFNKFLYDTRVVDGPNVTYPNARNTEAGGEVFQGVVEQCSIKACTNGVYFYSIVNRNIFNGTFINDCEVAYNLSEIYTRPESNVFQASSILNCASAFEWSAYDNNAGAPFSNTWIATRVENTPPRGGGCVVKDPGRQTFVNLEFFPNNDPAKINFVRLNTSSNMFSTIVGSNFDRRHDTDERGAEFNEKICAHNGISNKWFIHHHLTSTIPPHTYIYVNISTPYAIVGRAVAFSFNATYPMLLFAANIVQNGELQLVIRNIQGDPITMNCHLNATIIENNPL